MYASLHQFITQVQHIDACSCWRNSSLHKTQSLGLQNHPQALLYRAEYSSGGVTSSAPVLLQLVVARVALEAYRNMNE